MPGLAILDHACDACIVCHASCWTDFQNDEETGALTLSIQPATTDESFYMQVLHGP